MPRTSNNPTRNRITRLREKFDLPKYIPANILWYLSSYYATIQISVGSVDVVNGYGCVTFKKVMISRLPGKTVFYWDSFEKDSLEKAFEKKLPEISDEMYYSDWLETRRKLYVS